VLFISLKEITRLKSLKTKINFLYSYVFLRVLRILVLRILG